jgi:hypothetical protein
MEEFMAGHIWCKWSLLNVREGKCKGEHDKAQVKLEAERACFSSSYAFKNLC